MIDITVEADFKAQRLVSVVAGRMQQPSRLGQSPGAGPVRPFGSIAAATTGYSGRHHAPGGWIADGEQALGDRAAFDRQVQRLPPAPVVDDRKSTRLNSSQQ